MYIIYEQLASIYCLFTFMPYMWHIQSNKNQRRHHRKSTSTQQKPNILHNHQPKQQCQYNDSVSDALGLTNACDNGCTHIICNDLYIYVVGTYSASTATMQSQKRRRSYALHLVICVTNHYGKHVYV